MFPTNRQQGSIVLEYVLVTLFALIVTITLLGYLRHIFLKELSPLAEELGIDIDNLSIPFLNPGANNE